MSPIMVLLLLALVPIVNSMQESTTINQAMLLSRCANDSNYCAAKALDGECFGSSLTASVLYKKCRCTCDIVLTHRIRTCCETVGQTAMRFCLPLCRYNTTITELTSALGFKCVSQLTVWAYCAADASDNIDCCRSKGVPEECLSFCKGDVPTCDLQSIFSYQPCLKSLDSITKCQRANLQKKPQWDPEWSARCDWDG